MLRKREKEREGKKDRGTWRGEVVSRGQAEAKRDETGLCFSISPHALTSSSHSTASEGQQRASSNNTQPMMGDTSKIKNILDNTNMVNFIFTICSSLLSTFFPVKVIT